MLEKSFLGLHTPHPVQFVLQIPIIPSNPLFSMRQSSSSKMELPQLSMSTLQRNSPWTLPKELSPKHFNDGERGYFNIGGEEDGNMQGEC